MDKKRKESLIRDTNAAIDYMQRLYHEISYLIKETEAHLANETEEFVIGKPGGYAITTPTSKGLEAKNVDKWLLKRFAVFFVERKYAKTKGEGVAFSEGLKMLYLRILLDDANHKQPTIYFGAISEIENRNPRFTRADYIIGHLEYQAAEAFSSDGAVLLDDASLKLKGKLASKPLFEVNTSEDIFKKVIAPGLAIYRQLPTSKK